MPLQSNELASTEPAFQVSESPHLWNSFLILEARTWLSLAIKGWGESQAKWKTLTEVPWEQDKSLPSGSAAWHLQIWSQETWCQQSQEQPERDWNRMCWWRKHKKHNISYRDYLKGKHHFLWQRTTCHGHMSELRQEENPRQRDSVGKSQAIHWENYSRHLWKAQTF